MLANLCVVLKNGKLFLMSEVSHMICEGTLLLHFVNSSDSNVTSILKACYGDYENRAFLKSILKAVAHVVWNLGAINIVDFFSGDLLCK